MVSIFRDAIDQANGAVSVDTRTLETMGLQDTFNANPAETSSASVEKIFRSIGSDTGLVSSGVNRIPTDRSGAALDGFPVPLELSDSTLSIRDALYPVISPAKKYGSLAAAKPQSVKASVTDFPQYNLIPYPDINFGYGEPGGTFIAKRNWWAFTMNLAGNDAALADSQMHSRDFVFSIYEVPSQLAISAEAYANIGTHRDGTAWKNTNIQGGIFATRMDVASNMKLSRVSGRTGINIADYSKIGDAGRPITGNPFEPGVREKYEATHDESLPVYLSSESGRSAFIPLNGGQAFFDRYAIGNESNTLSGTGWNTYSSGASKCAMRLDITAMSSGMPTQLRFSYLAGTQRVDSLMTVDAAAWENSSPPKPFTVKKLVAGGVTKNCVVIRPELFPAYLASLNASGVSSNHSISVNVDYTATGMNNAALAPAGIRTSDCGVILKDCNNLSAYNKGFSLVTNMLLYIGDDFNQVPTTAPAGVSGTFYPPTSLFAPDKRFGTDTDPGHLQLTGQIGHLGGDTGSAGRDARLLDLQLGSSALAPADSIQVNLSPIIHPGQLPPVVMLNWLVVMEERRKEFFR